MPERIIAYEGLPMLAEGQTLQTVTLTRDETVSLADSIREATSEAYTAQFEEGPQPRLRPGSMAREFDPHKVGNYIDRMLRHYDECDARWTAIFAKSEDGERRLQSYVKLGALGSMTDGEFGTDGLYVNNIITRPLLNSSIGWGKSYGSAVLHAALEAAIARKPELVEPDARLVLDAFDDSSVNNWYWRLGLRPRPDIPSRDPRPQYPDGVYTLDGQPMPQTYYVTPDPNTVLLRPAGITGVKRRLEERYPSLAAGQIISAA